MSIYFNKPLGMKAYGSIPHLPGSKLGIGDHRVADGQATILISKTRDVHDQVFCYEKLDGSCVSVAKLSDGRIVPLIRAGYLAEASTYMQHHLWSDWVYSNYDRFNNLLRPNERICGEWLAQAHGTKYILEQEPFVPFDIFSGTRRVLQTEFISRCLDNGFVLPRLLFCGLKPPNPLRTSFSIEDANSRLNDGLSPYKTTDVREGAVWRVERNGKVDFLAKWVDKDFIAGKYLFGDVVWNENLELYLPSKGLERLAEVKRSQSK